MRTLQLKTVLCNLAIVLFTLGVTGCVLKEPLSDPVQAKPDERLFGAWKVEDMKIEGVRKKQEEYCILTIGKAELRGAPPGILKAIEISNNAEQKIEVKDLYFFTTSIGARTYANILEDYFDDKRKEGSVQRKCNSTKRFPIFSSGVPAWQSLPQLLWPPKTKIVPRT